jgi:hypothetical protein
MALTTARQKELRDEMKKRLQVTAKRRGAMKTAGGQHKNVGSVKGSRYRPTMAGFKGLNKEEIQFVKGERSTNKASGDTKTTYKKAFKLGAADTKDTKGKPSLVTQAKKDKMKSIKKGGTVGKGTHASGAARKDAKAWRANRVAALKKKHNIGAGSTAAQRTAFKDARGKVIDRHKRMVKKA